MPKGDTISRYESYDMFSVSQKPRRSDEKLANPTKNIRDTVETSQEKTDRLSPPKVAPSDNRAAKASQVEVGRAGRYVFMAVCLPPYIVLYGIPKWIAVNLLPEMMKLAGKTLTMGGSAAENLKAWLAEAIIRPLRDAFGKLLFLVKELGKSASEFLSYLKQGLLRPFILMKETALYPFKKGAELAQQLVKKARDLIKAPLTLAKRLTDGAKEIGKGVQGAFESAKASIAKVIETAAGIAAPMLEFAKRIAHNRPRLSLKVNFSAEKSAKKLKSLTDGIGNIAQQVKQIPSQIVSQTVVPLINLFVEMRTRAADFGRAALRRLRDKLKSEIKGAVSKVKSALGGAKKFFYQLPRKARERVQKIVRFVRGPVAVFIKEEVPFLVDAYEYILRIIRRVVMVMRAVYQFLKKQVLLVAGFAIFHYGKAAQKVRLATNVLIALMGRFFKAFRNSLKGSGKALMSLSRGFASVFKAVGSLFRELHSEVRSWIA